MCMIDELPSSLVNERLLLPVVATAWGRVRYIGSRQMRHSTSYDAQQTPDCTPEISVYTILLPLKFSSPLETVASNQPNRIARKTGSRKKQILVAIPAHPYIQIKKSASSTKIRWPHFTSRNFPSQHPPSHLLLSYLESALERERRVAEKSNRQIPLPWGNKHHIYIYIGVKLQCKDTSIDSMPTTPLCTLANYKA